jgi:thiol-disulfide isomerase/thioredoxin
VLRAWRAKDSIRSAGLTRLGPAGHAAAQHMRLPLQTPGWALTLLLVAAQSWAVTPLPGPRVGAPAPALTIERWLRGGAVARFEPGRVYVLDLWAPWCGPCLGNMPELSKLQDRYGARGLVVIGLTGADDYGSTLEKAQQAVAARAGQIRYRIAWDHDRETYRRWMATEFEAGWPWSFVIDRKGRVAYIGHPSALPRILEPILDGTWNLDSARTAYDRRATMLGMVQAFVDAYHASNYEEAQARYDSLCAFDPASGRGYAGAIFKMKRNLQGRRDDAMAFARQTGPEMTRDDVGTIVRMVDLILAPEPAATPAELDLALDLAERARRLADSHDAGTIAALAAVRYRRGDVAGAIRTQQEAVEAAGPNDRAAFEEKLALYRKAAH